MSFWINVRKEPVSENVNSRMKYANSVEASRVSLGQPIPISTPPYINSAELHSPGIRLGSRLLKVQSFRSLCGPNRVLDQSQTLGLIKL